MDGLLQFKLMTFSKSVKRHIAIGRADIKFNIEDVLRRTKREKLNYIILYQLMRNLTVRCELFIVYADIFYGIILCINN